jgi:hypothetical protein
VKQAFTITVNSVNFSALDGFRLKMLEYLKTSLGFDSLYILDDHISMNIAEEIYPSLYKVESFLRKYIVKFFAVKLGPEWWDLTAGTEMQKKTNARKNNEVLFSQFVDNHVYLIDFGELGRLIYSQSTGHLSREDIVGKILEIEETVEALQNFKNDIQTNYNKFFRSAFKENDFQNKWEELEKIRHKVAHNGLFTIDDRSRSRYLVADLIRIIDRANKDIDSIAFSEDDRGRIISSFVSSFRPITQAQFEKELDRSLVWSKNNADGFVALSNFRRILAAKGYDYHSINEVLAKLIEAGRVCTYQHVSDKNSWPVTSIRFKS